MPLGRLTEQQLTDTIREVIENARKRQEAYFPRGAPLGPEQKDWVHAFYPKHLLDEVRVLELKDEQHEPTPRLLFHAPVHVTQYALLGLERYLELYVRAFAQSGSYTSVPFEVQAFRLDQRYTEDPSRVFSVEAEVRSWVENNSYIVAATTEKKAREVK